VIILNKKKIIIFHNRKTSGTSFGILMSIISDKGDFFSFHGVKPNINKKIIKKINYFKNQKFLDIDFINTTRVTLYYIYLLFQKKILKKKYKKKIEAPFIIYKSKYYSHTTPDDFKKNISKKIYNDYSKFSIYRKFSDQIYSMYNHKMSYDKFINYEQWISENLEDFYINSLKFYKDDIYYFNFHKMENSLKQFCKKKHIKEDLAMYYKNIKQRTENKKYPKILKNLTKKKILDKEKIISKLVKKRLLAK